jgi:DNA-binding transcriptional LysR family regulator
MGLGIALVSSAMCGPELKAKQLLPLLRDYTMDPVDVHAVFPGGPRPSTKVRAFVDFLAERLKDSEGPRRRRKPARGAPGQPRASIIS